MLRGESDQEWSQSLILSSPGIRDEEEDVPHPANMGYNTGASSQASNGELHISWEEKEEEGRCTAVPANCKLH